MAMMKPEDVRYTSGARSKSMWTRGDVLRYNIRIQGRIQGGSLGAEAPPSPPKSTYTTYMETR